MDSCLYLWLSKLTLKIELQHSYLKSYQSIIYDTALAGIFILVQNKPKSSLKKPHKPSHYIYMLLYAPSIQNTGYGRTLLYLAPTSGCVLRVCKGRRRGCSSCHMFNQKSYPWWWLFSGKDKKHLS